MKKLLHFFLFMTFTFCLKAEKHALLIGISNYPTDGDWETLSSDNDLIYIKEALKLSDFKNNNIYTLLNEAATYQRILDSIKELEQTVSKGDIIFIHFSGHGQQVRDNNKDEIDRLDEAIVPYDSPKHFNKGIYEGERLIRDDQLGRLTTMLRTKLGPTGQLILVLDACHSGTGNRGQNRVRGTQEIMAPSNFKVRRKKQKAELTMEISTTAKNKNLAPMASYFASSANELNYETFDDQLKPIGSLSYAIASILANSSTITFDELYERIVLRMKTLAPKQHPQWEGIPSKVLFGENNKSEQQQLFSIAEQINEVTFEANFGTLSGIFEGSLVEIYSIDQQQVLVIGEVTKANLLTSIIKCEQVVKSKFDELLKVRIVSKSANPLMIAIRFDIPSNSKWSSLTDAMQEKQYIHQSLCNADLYLQINSKDKLLLRNIDGKILFQSIDLDCEYELLRIIKSFGQAKFLKAYQTPESTYQFSIQLLQADCNHPEVDINKLTPIKRNKLKVDDCIQVAIKNTGNEPAYFSLLDIQPDHVFNLVIPKIDTDKTPSDFYLEPNQTYLTDYVIDVLEPIGEETLKLICTDQPLNLAPIIAQKGTTKRGPTDLHPFEKFFLQTFNPKRRSATTSTDLNEVGVTTLFFEIVK